MTDDFIGVWHICEMKMWDKDFFNIEIQAYFKLI
jgi:hypothetical protein